MPTGLYDIHDRAEVLHPQEIEQGRAECVKNKTQYINQPNGGTVPLAVFVERLNKRWARAVRTSQVIDAIKAGYCSIEPKTAPPGSDARH